MAPTFGLRNSKPEAPLSAGTHPPYWRRGFASRSRHLSKSGSVLKRLSSTAGATAALCNLRALKARLSAGGHFICHIIRGNEMQATGPAPPTPAKLLNVGPAPLFQPAELCAQKFVADCCKVCSAGTMASADLMRIALRLRAGCINDGAAPTVQST